MTLIAASVVGLAGCSADGLTTPTSAAPSPRGPSFAIGDVPSSALPEVGKLKLCKSSSSNVSGTFTIGRQALGGSVGTALTAATLAPGACVVVAEDVGLSGVGSMLTVTETSAGLTGVTAQLVGIDGIVTPAAFSNGGSVFINSFHGYSITFTNVVTPPAAACDFITFGRLVTSVGGKKVVISGNAGGNKPAGGILGEFHIDANGVDNHVADIATYGPITSGPLSGLTNSRIVTGTAKNGVAVELRLWDGGEPGKDTDVVYVKLNGVVVLNAAGQTIDQGNMQYHPNCRGPND
ncbi:MAG: hypothetical protein ABIP93_18345 [Gemmatimonadaceae bacterium]